MSYKKQHDFGFTIIEVVLVLALAGFLFILVFAALPQLSRSRRDHQRKLAAQFVVGQIEGTQPYPRTIAEHNAFTASLAGNELMIDPSTGVAYVMDYRKWDTASHSDVPAVGEIYYQVSHRCSLSGTDPIASTTPGSSDDDYSAFAVWVGLENAAYACFDNS